MLVSYYGGKTLYLEDNEKASPVDISLVVYKRQNPSSARLFLRMNQNATPHTQVHSAPASGYQSKQHDTANVQPNLQIWLQLLRITY